MLLWKIRAKMTPVTTDTMTPTSPGSLMMHATITTMIGSSITGLMLQTCCIAS